MAEQHNGIANHKGSVVKDENCAGMVAIMMELKYFDEQFVYYGTAYVENNVIKYRIHDKAEKMYQFFEKSAQKSLYPLGIVRYVQYKKVPSGKENEVASEVQASLVEYLKQIYPKELFYLVQKVGETKANNNAQDILQSWQDKLELCFEEDQINLFAGAVKMAYQAKLIDDKVFQQFMEWVENKVTQIISHTNSKWRKPYKMHGFIYWENGKLKIYVNALWQKAAERFYEIKASKLFCTPIFSKTYWLDSMPAWDLTKWRSKFEKDLTLLMDDEYCAYLKQIWSLPAVANKELYQQLSQRIDIEQYPEAKKVLDYYAAVWKCS